MYYTQFLARKCLQKCCPCLCAVALWRPGFSRFFPLRLWAQNANNLDLASGTEETFQSCKHANVIDWTLLIAVFPTNCCVISVITAAEQEVRMLRCLHIDLGICTNPLMATSCQRPKPAERTVSSANMTSVSWQQWHQSRFPLSTGYIRHANHSLHAPYNGNIGLCE